MSEPVRLDRLIGRKILTGNNRRLGRLEECRAERMGDAWVITEWVIGSAGLLERLGFGVRMILGVRAGRSFVARWDQVDISDPERPRLTCSMDELKRAE
jgi:hypothetical protein